MPPPAKYTKYETRRRDPNPRTAALLVIDVQGHFAPLAAPAMPAIARTVALCRGAGMPVVYTRHVDAEPRSGPLEEWWPGDRIDAGTPANELLPGAGRVPGDLDGAGGGAARGGRRGGGRSGRDDQPVLRDHRAGRVRARVPGVLLRRRHPHRKQ
jgi:hypothetical protein